MKKRVCKKCKRSLELNKKNFRYSRRWFLHICLSCENKRKRYVRVHDEDVRRKIKPAQINPFRPTVEELIEKYNKIFSLLREHCVDIEYRTGEEVDCILKEIRKMRV